MRGPGLHRTGRMPDVARYERVLELHDAGWSRRQIMAELGTADHMLLNRALAWRNRKAVRLAHSEPDPVAARVADLEATVARLCGVLQTIMEHPAEPSDRVDLAPVMAQLDALGRRLDQLEVARAPSPVRRNHLDAPDELIRRQLDVVVRELGPHKAAELVEGLSRSGAESFARGGGLPRMGPDAIANLDRFYVIVRAAQLDIEADDDDVEDVRRAIRAREVTGVSALAWEEAS